MRRAPTIDYAAHAAYLSVARRPYAFNDLQRRYGAVGDGQHDDTQAVQDAIVESLTTNVPAAAPVLYLPGGTYAISATLTLGSDTRVGSFRWVGDAGGGQFQQTTLLWVGSKLRPMLEVKNSYQSEVEQINFNGNELALSCFHLKPFSTANRYRRCSFLNTAVVAARQPNHAYANGDLVTSATIPGLSFQDNGHLFVAGNVTGPTSGSLVVFPNAPGSTVVDGGVTWTECGQSPAAFAMGELAGPNLGSQTDLPVFHDCYFQGTNQRAGAGFRTLSGANVKSYHFFACNFAALGAAIDLQYSSGSLTGFGCTFSGNGCDLNLTGLNDAVFHGLSSEGSSYLLFGNLGTGGAAPVSITGYWDGSTPTVGHFAQYGPGDAFIQYGGYLELSGCKFSDGNMDFPCLMIGNSQGTGAGGLRSARNMFAFKHDRPTYKGSPFPFLPVFDPSLNGMSPGSPSFLSGYGVLNNRVSSDGDVFQPDIGGTTLHVPRFDGQDLHMGRQQVGNQAGVNTSHGVTVNTSGSIVGADFCATIDHAAVAVGANTVTLLLGPLANKTRVRSVCIDPTTAFAGPGITGVTASLGTIVPATAGGVASPAALLAPASIAAATDTWQDVPLPQGLVWGPTTGKIDGSEQFELTVTFASTGAPLSALAQGSLDVHVVFETLPGFTF